MRAPADPVLVKRLSVFASAASVFPIAVGLSVLAGWTLGVRVLITWGLGTPMAPNAAACIVLAGVSLWLRRKHGHPSTPIGRVAAHTTAAIVTIVGLLTLAEHIFSVRFGIDRLLLRTPLPPQLANARILMSPIGAGNFLLLGLALLLIDWRTRRNDWPTQFLCFGAAMAPAFGLLGLLVGPKISPITLSLPAVFSYSLLASGLICSRATWAMGGLLTSQNSGARLLRRATPAALIVLGLIGWSISRPLLTDSYISWVAASIIAVVSGAALAGFIAWMAFVVERSDSQRRKLEEASDASQEDLDRLLNRIEEPEAEWRLRRKVTAGFAVAILLTGLLGFLSWRANRQSAEDADWVAHTREVSTTLELTLRHLLDVETGGRGFALDGEEKFLEPYEAGKGGVGQDLKKLSALMADNSGQLLRLDLLRRQANARIEATEELIAIRRSSRSAATDIELQRGKKEMDAARLTIAQMEAAEKTLLDQRTGRLRKTAHFTTSVIAFGAVLGVVFLTVAGHTVSREIGISARSRAQINVLNANLERRVAERTEALGESEGRLAGVIQSAMDAILTVDEQQNVLMFNGAAERMFRCAAAEALGQPVTRFIPQRFHAAHAGHIHKFAEAGVTTRTMGPKNVLWAVRADGQEFQIEASISQVVTGGKKLFTVILRDVTERVQAEAEREHLASVVDSSDDAIISKDLNGIINAWNRGAEKIFGYSAAEAVGRPMLMLFPQNLVNEEPGILARIRRGEGVEHYETVRVRKDGRLIDVSVTISPIRDRNGTIVGASKIARDITERKQAEAARLLAEERYRRFVERTAAGVLRNTLDGRILESNDAMVRMLGYDSRAEFLARPTPEIHYVNPEERRLLVERLKQDGTLNNYEACFQRKDGTPVWVVMSLVLVQGEDEVGDFLEATVIDVTARKLAEQQLARQADQLYLQSEELIRSQEALEAQTLMLQSVLDSTEEGLIATNERGEFIIWNPAAARILGLQVTNTHGHECTSHYNLFLPDMVTPLPNEQNPLAQALDGRVNTAEIFVRNPALAEGIWIESSGSPLKRKDGLVRGGVVAFRDITERKKADRRMADQADLLSQQTEELIRSQSALEAQTRMLKLILESVGEGLIAADREGRFIIWNDSAKKLMGRESADLPSDQWTQHYKVFLPDGVTPYPAESLPLVRALRGESVQVELMVEQPESADGVFLEVTARPMKDEEGGSCGAVAVLRDITEHRRAATALARQAEELLRSQQSLETQTIMLQSVLDSIDEGLVAADENGKFILWNPAATRIVGMGAESVLPGEWNSHYGVYLPDGVTPLPAEQNPLARALHGDVSTAEIVLRNPELEEGVWLEISGGPLKGRDGSTRGGVVAFRDISQRKKDEREIRALNEELEARVEQRTEELAASNLELEAFTYSVSHDLRAPLRHIGGFSRILLEDFGSKMEPEALSHLHRIEDGTRRMGLLVDELLNLARVGRHSLKLEATPLNPIVEEVISLLQPEVNGRVVEWRIAELPSAMCDPILIKQVFQNLIANALKFTRPRERAVIEIGHRQENGQIPFFIRDNGVGFSMKYQDKLFGVFQRLHRAEDFEGTGIGLATVKRIVHKHGGRVWADSELDKGATFYFTLGAAKHARDMPAELVPGGAENKTAVAGA